MAKSEYLNRQPSLPWPLPAAPRRAETAPKNKMSATLLECKRVASKFRANPAAKAAERPGSGHDYTVFLQTLLI